MARMEIGVNFGELKQKLRTSLRYGSAVRRALPEEPEFNVPFKMLSILAKDMGTTTGIYLEAMGDPELMLKLRLNRDAAIEDKPLSDYPDYPHARVLRKV